MSRKRDSNGFGALLYYTHSEADAHNRLKPLCFVVVRQRTSKKEDKETSFAFDSLSLIVYVHKRGVTTRQP